MSEAALQVHHAAAVIEQNLPAYALAPVMTVEQARQRLDEIRQFISQAMVEGEDYGRIPGTEKPTLLKPGAEKLAEFYGLAPTIVIQNRVERWDEPGFFHYEVLCRLIHKRTGVIVAEGVGSCNSKEARYRYRWVPEYQLPEDYDKRKAVTRKSRDGRTLYRIENDDVFSLANTILKMAKKRALVDAVLSATRSSGIFTQDLEDIGLSPDDDLPPAQPATTPKARASAGNGHGGASRQRGNSHGYASGSASRNGQQRSRQQEHQPATTEQARRIDELRAVLGWSKDDLRAQAEARYGVSSARELTKEQADDLIQWLEDYVLSAEDVPFDDFGAESDPDELADAHQRQVVNDMLNRMVDEQMVDAGGEGA